MEVQFQRFLDITERMMESFSTDEFQIKKEKESLTVISNGYTAEDLLYEIEPDATAAGLFSYPANCCGREFIS